MTTVRERIEELDDDPEFGGPVVLSDRERKVIAEFKLGNLIPADEVDARIAEAVAGERQRCARIADNHQDKRRPANPYIELGGQLCAKEIATAIRGTEGDEDGVS